MQQCPDGYHQAQHARSVTVAERLIEKQLTPNQMFDSRQNAAWGPQPKSLPIYISWYIKDHGRPWTSSDLNPKKGPTTDQYARSSGCCFRLRIRRLGFDP